MTYFYTGLFGLMGVFSRYFFGIYFGKILPSPFPFPTFFINILGSFLIGVIYVLGAERSALSPELRIGMMVGFLGGFTTFSSFALEGVRLFEENENFYAVLYLVLSPILGCLATLLGMTLIRKLSF